MKLGSRVLGFAMSVLIAVSSTAPAMALEVEPDRNSGETAKSSAQAAAPLAAQVEISTQDLFRLYPFALSPDMERMVFGQFDTLYQTFVDDYSTGSTWIASYLYGLKNGSHILVQDLMAWFGWGDSFKEEVAADAMQILQKAIFNKESAAEQIVNSVAANLSSFRFQYNLYDTAARLSYIAALKKDFKNLTPKQIEEICDAVFGQDGKLLGYASDGVELCKIVTTFFMLQEIQLESIMTLIKLTPSYTDLHAQLLVLLDTTRKNLVQNFIDGFLQDKVIAAVVKFVEKHMIGEVFDISSLSFSVAKLCINIFVDHLYSGPQADEIAKLCLLQAYERDLVTAVYARRTYFMDCSQKGNPISEQDVEQYLFLYESLLASQKAILEYAIKLDPGYMKKPSLELMVSVLNTYTTNKYLDLCKQEVQDQINAGVLKSPAAIGEDGNVSNIQPEESHTSIREKFSQIQEVYPPNRGIVFTDSYNGKQKSLGFAQMVFNKLFDCDMPGAYYESSPYAYDSENNVLLLGQLEGTITAQQVKELLSQAKLGDIIQASGHVPHTMIVVEADDTGIVLYDVNEKGDDIIRQVEKSYAELAAAYSKAPEGSKPGLSLYRAANYDTLYWDGVDIFYDENADFVIKDGVLLAYNGSQRHVQIPERVVEIAKGAFRNKDIETVICPESLLWIEDEAFSGCSSLYFVMLNTRLRIIGRRAFAFCTSLTSIFIPQEVEAVGNEAFKECTALDSVDMAFGVTEIEAEAFFGCTALAQVNMPDSITRIGAHAFGNCSALQTLRLSKSLVQLESFAFGGSALEEIEIPKSLESGGSAFINTKLRNVTFEEGTTRIADWLFSHCASLRKIVIPDTVTVIEEYAFYGCEKLGSIVFPDSLITIEKYAFKGSAFLQSLVLPANLQTIGEEAFGGCSWLASVFLPDTVTEIGRAAFAGTDLSQVRLPRQLVTMGGGVFGGTSITAVEIPKSVVNGGGAFGGMDHLKTVTFETGTLRVADSLFKGCTSLEEIIIPDTVASVERYAFQGCSRLKRVVFPDSVTRIADYAFSNCQALTSVTLPNRLPSVGRSAFEGCSLLSNVVFPESVTKIERYAFANCPALKQIQLPKGLVTMESGAFAYTSLSAVTIPKSLESGGTDTGAFKGVDTLKTVTFEPGITRIADTLFCDCTGLEEIVIPSTVSVIEFSAFSRCSRLKRVVIPEGVTDFNSHAFSQCVSLESIALPHSLKNLSNDVFAGCTALKEVSIPDNTISSVWPGLFNGCSQLENLVIPEGATQINYNAFTGCTALKKVQIPKTMTRIDDTAFSAPQNLTIYGYTGSYAESFARSKGAAFVYLDTPSQSLKPADGQYHIVLDRGEYRLLEFVMLPADTTDTITLSYSDPYIARTDGFELYGVGSGDCTITAKTTSGLTCELTVHVRTPEQLTIKEPPTKTTYYIGEDFDAEGLILEIQYDDGSTQVVEDYTVSGFDSSSEGACTVALTFAHPYRTFKATLEVNIVDPTPKLESIAIGRLPDKRIYLRGELLDMSGAQILGRYSDGSQKEITEYQTSGYNALKTGKQTITVSVEGKTTSFTVEVVAKRIERLEITHLPDKTEYQPGEKLRLDGLVVMAYYTDGSSQEITDYTVSGFDTTPGEKEVVITAQGVSVTFTVTVLKGTAPVPGDTDGDGTVSDRDAQYLLYYIFYPDSYPVYQDCDFNSDESVDDRDAQYLLYHIFFPDSYPLSP